MRNFEKKNIFYTYEALKKFEKQSDKKDFINLLISKQAGVKDIYVYKLPANLSIGNKYTSVYLPEEQSVIFALIDEENVQISKKVTLDYIHSQIFDDFNAQKRQIYVLDENKKLIPEEIEKAEKSEELSDEMLENAAGGCLIPLSKKQTEKM